MSKIPSSLNLLIIFPVLMNQVGYIINTIRLNYQTCNFIPARFAKQRLVIFSIDVYVSCVLRFWIYMTVYLCQKYSTGICMWLYNPTYIYNTYATSDIIIRIIYSDYHQIWTWHSLNIHSFFMPMSKHFFKRQPEQNLRVWVSSLQFPSKLHAKTWKSIKKTMRS